MVCVKWAGSPKTGVVIGVPSHFELSLAKGVLLLFNKEDISKMRTMLTEDWV